MSRGLDPGDLRADSIGLASGGRGLFPPGRLAGPFERRLVAATYAAAIGFQLVRMVLGEPPTSFMVTDAPEAAKLAFRIQLVLVSGLALTGVGLIVVRRRAEGHSLRRPLALLIYSFSFSLVMIAFLLVTAVLGKPQGGPSTFTNGIDEPGY